MGIRIKNWVVVKNWVVRVGTRIRNWVLKLSVVAVCLIFLAVALLPPAVTAYFWPIDPSWVDWVRSFVPWLGTRIESLFPWPITVIGITLFALSSPIAYARLRTLLRMVRKVKVGSAEVELSPETRREFKNAADEISLFIKNYRSELKREVDRLVENNQVYQKLIDLVDEHVETALNPPQLPRNYRCTVHVQDFLFKLDLYQLLNYYPSGGGPAGRVLSVRRGIIGKVWRSGLPITTGSLFGDNPTPPKTDRDMIKDIALNWGLMLEEAREVLNKQSYCCIPLETDSKQVGVLYMDSTDDDAFGQTKEQRQKFESIVRTALDLTGLTVAVERVIEKLDEYSPRITIAD